MKEKIQNKNTKKKIKKEKKYNLPTRAISPTDIFLPGGDGHISTTPAICLLLFQTFSPNSLYYFQSILNRFVNRFGVSELFWSVADSLESKPY